MKDFKNKGSFGMGPPWMQGGGWGKWFQVMQAGRGEIKNIILNALAEKPMHGYEIIRYFEQKSHGHWRPSPGSVYPTLQSLEDEGLILSKKENGKIVYSITDRGKKTAKKQQPTPPWEGVKHPERMAEFWPLMRDLMKTLRWLSVNGSESDYQKTQTIIKETTAKLMALKKECEEET